MDVKLIALDLDGTAFTDNGTLSEANKKAIKTAIKKGIHIIIASGRSFYTIPKCIIEIPGIKYAVTSNGACIHDAVTGNVILKNTLNPHCLKQLLEIEKPYGLMKEVFITGKAYSQKDYIENAVSYGASPKFADYIKRTRMPVDNIVEFIEDNIDNIDNIDFTLKPDTPKKFIDDIKNVEGIYITSSVSHLLEIADIKAGKGSALKTLAQKLNVSRENIVAFGNAQNDGDMLEFAHIGIAVENSSPELKMRADKICPDNNHDGVAWAFEHILGIY